jgi:tRNA (guanine-N7-)-methyltransferase
LNDQFQKAIRSYVLREGRITPAQRKALADHWPTYGLEFDLGLLDLPIAFPSPGVETDYYKRTVLDIGFGMGDSLIESMIANPTTRFIGVEVHGPGVGHLMNLADNLKLCNLRIYRHDVVEVLRHCIPDQSLDKVQVLFPDPWPKKKHHKRRLVQQPLIKLFAAKLKTGGVLHMATDWTEYAEHMKAVMDSSHGFAVQQSAVDRPTTKYENRAKRLGHEIADLIYKRTAD